MLNTGFSEITEERLLYKGKDPWYVEVAITGRCNFHCTYCNRFSQNLDMEKFKAWIDTQQNQFRHLQITGGEPTVHPEFEQIVQLCRSRTKVLGLSTNGSWSLEKYLHLPVDMFSISFDDYDLDILRSRGYNNPEHILNCIKELAKVRYVNIGLVIDEHNVSRAEAIIDFLLQLGVSDVKLSISTRALDTMPVFTKLYEGYPILSYRVNNFKNQKPMRGYPAPRCHIAKNDITIVGDKHYPCLVYFREKGSAIGNLDDESMLQDREAWSESHDCLKDPICSKFCMDFKCDFNHAKGEQ
jgi:MoaA/NifB/PqqE/SkfB family radical SAM enzyme